MARVLKAIELVATEHNASIGQVVLAWTLQQPGVSHVLAGTRNAEQAMHNANAGRVVLSQESLDAIHAAATNFEGFE